jgi:dihydroxyacetone kinase
MDAARALKEQDPDYNSFLAAALVFRTAAAAFQAAGDNARAQAATDEAQTLEDNIKIASEKAGLRGNRRNYRKVFVKHDAGAAAEVVREVGEVASRPSCASPRCSHNSPAKSTTPARIPHEGKAHDVSPTAPARVAESQQRAAAASSSSP